MWKTITQPIYAVWVAFTFVVSLLFVFPASLLLAMFFPAKAGHAIHRLVATWARLWLGFIGMPVRIYGKRQAEGACIIVTNHVSYLDPLVMFAAMSRFFKPLGKREIVSVPLLGYIYSKLVIPVDRSSNASRANSMRLMQAAVERGEDIVIFPEGGFNETGQLLKSFHDGAFKLAAATGTSIMPIVLPDTLHRWHYSKWYKLWPGQNRVIVLPTVPVTQGMDVKTLKTDVYNAMEATLQQYHQQ